MTTQDLRRQLDELHQERLLADALGLSGNETYMDDLVEEIATVRSAWMGAAVTDIAVFRAQLDGPQRG